VVNRIGIALGSSAALTLAGAAAGAVAGDGSGP
jgi:hypothetical protein